MNVTDLYNIQAMCAELGIEAPPPIVRGLELIAVANEHAEPPAGPLLSLSDAAARDRINDLSSRAHLYTHTGTGTGLVPGIEQFTAQLLGEVREETMPHVEGIVEALRSPFDAAATPIIVAALDYGYTWATTSDDVVDRADEAASQAWRDLRDALAAIQQPARMRIEISRVFGLEPTVEDVRKHYARQREFDATVTEDRIDYTVLFAAGDGWSFSRGFYIEPKRGGGSMLDWLALARDGLRLNSVAEVREKLAARAMPALAEQG